MSTFSDQPENKVIVVAELSANHGHSLETALATVRAAKESGADAVKLQTYTADTITLDCDNEHFRVKGGTIWDGTTLYKLYQEAYTPWEWHEAIKEEARNAGLDFFSTPFDPTAVDFLETLGVPCFKIASFEITDIPLIEYAASKGKPMIISTGIATLDEIGEAVAACRRVGNRDITLLKCTSAYPAPVETANLATMANMREAFGVKVGLSDHTTGVGVAIAAAALGACMIEKHFILDWSIGGPDASFSMEPAEFAMMVQGIREAERSVGSVRYPLPGDNVSGRQFARSLYVVEDIEAGMELTRSNVRSIRPGNGLAPKYLASVLGKKARARIERGTPLSWEQVE